MGFRSLYASEESIRLIEDLESRLDDLEKSIIDHTQRFDTLQTPWPKRIWFWLKGWPWYDLNAPARRWRPWRWW